MLRTVNIPVEFPRVCTHHQIYFRSEALYLDHGDNPYFAYENAMSPPEAAIIDQATYESGFGTNELNEGCNEAQSSQHCKNVGRRAAELQGLWP